MFIVVDREHCYFIGPFSSYEEADIYIKRPRDGRTLVILSLFDVDKLMGYRSFRLKEEKAYRFPIIIYAAFFQDHLLTNDIAFGLIRNVSEGNLWINIHKEMNPDIGHVRFTMYGLENPNY